MKAELVVCDHQTVDPLPAAWLVLLERAGSAALERILGEPVIRDSAPLPRLEAIEIALVDDDTSDRVHRDFMGIPGATDVITFAHGEIVIGRQVATRQAEEYGEPELRELLRYLVHGLLHLAGHEDTDPADRRRMETAQETLLARLWEEFGEDSGLDGGWRNR